MSYASYMTKHCFYLCVRLCLIVSFRDKVHGVWSVKHVHLYWVKVSNKLVLLNVHITIPTYFHKYINGVWASKTTKVCFHLRLTNKYSILTVTARVRLWWRTWFVEESIKRRAWTEASLVWSNSTTGHV